MADMLVNLLNLPSAESLYKRLKEDHNIYIRRALVPDKFRIVEWVKEHSSLSAAGECDVCFSRLPVSCFIATRGACVLGYACYNATAPDFCGPTRVLDEEQGKGIGKALLFGGERAVVVAEGFFVFLLGEVFFRHRGHSIRVIYPRVG